MKTLSRRDFLKLGGLALASLAFTSFLPETTGFEDIDLVRVANIPVSVYATPSDKSTIVATWPVDSLIHVYETVKAETPVWNPIWYRVYGGYMSRARLQKVRIVYNTPLSAVPATKLLAELTVPFTDTYRYDKWNGWYQYYRLYYSATQWITDVTTGPDGKAWYAIEEEADKNIQYFVPAVQMRPIPPEELTPISPDVPLGNKRIDVNLKTQTLYAYEFDQQVYTADISSGLINLFPTPVGQHNIMVKLPSRDMSAHSLASDVALPLVGVPWCSFFTAEGHALHGTYWHDNFGLPMSHGCINMRNEDAKWMFRWSQPTAGFDEIDKVTLDRKGFGTFMNVHF
ncbi:MAG TPA: L,D-transpeptidase family protein [Anaerolineales bacterium]|nr:L,D-transpeptidase family protein [Anaerolineales bacterium]